MYVILGHIVLKQTVMAGISEGIDAKAREEVFNIKERKQSKYLRS